MAEVRDVVPLSTWRHIATDSTYTALGIAQCSTNGKEMERSVVYVSHTYGAVSEFLDGRFERLS